MEWLCLCWSLFACGCLLMVVFALFGCVCGSLVSFAAGWLLVLIVLFELVVLMLFGLFDWDS